jgi:hypothetical protein
MAINIDLEAKARRARLACLAFEQGDLAALEAIFADTATWDQPDLHPFLGDRAGTRELSRRHAAAPAR